MKMNRLKQFFKGFKEGMNDFGSCISTIINSALLLIVYIIGVGLTSLFAKLAGKHFFSRRPSSKKDTYWSDLNLKRKPIEDYYRQF